MDGAFHWGTTKVNGAGSGENDRYAYFNASKGGSDIYGQDNTVVPESLGCIYLIKY